MLKKINEAFDRIYQEGKTERTKTIDEMLTEANELDESKSLKRINESKKQLNEGAGAGYNINGALHSIVISKINNIKIGKEDFAFGEVEYATLDVVGTGLFDGYAESYYHQSENIEDMKVAIDSVEINPNFLNYNGIEDYNEITLEMLNNAFKSETIPFDSETIGRGWFHKTFDGKVRAQIEDMPYEFDYINFHLTNKDDIQYLDDAVQGNFEDNFEEEDIEENLKEDTNKSLKEEYIPTISDNRKFVRYSKEWYEWLKKAFDKHNVDKLYIKFTPNRFGEFERTDIEDQINFNNRMEIEEKEIHRLLNDFVGDDPRFELTNFGSKSREKGLGIGTNAGAFWLGSEPNTLLFKDNKGNSYTISSKEDIEKLDLTESLKESYNEEYWVVVGYDKDNDYYENLEQFFDKKEALAYAGEIEEDIKHDRIKGKIDNEPFDWLVIDHYDKDDNLLDYESFYDSKVQDKYDYKGTLQSPKSISRDEIEETFKESLKESKNLNESARDEYDEIIDRAKSEIDDGYDVDEAIWNAIDSYAYLDEFEILKELFNVDELYLKNGESVSTVIMEHIFDRVYGEVSDYKDEHDNNEEDIDESLDNKKSKTAGI